MIITRKFLSRRATLRGIGASVALPFLDAMVPAFAAKKTPKIKRLGFVYAPNGIIMDRWTPAAEGADFEFTPTLEPLAPFADKLLVVSGLAQANGWPLGDGPGDHGRAGATFLTGVHPRKTEGANIRAGISADQIAAKVLGRTTRVGSLEIGLEPGALGGNCDSGYSCAYTNTISWRDATTPLPFEINPRTVFERIFGDDYNFDPHARRERIRQDRSLLDFIHDDLARMESNLGPSDRLKIQQYLDSVRDVELRIHNHEKQQSRLPAPQRPAGIPPSFEEHAGLMIDLQVLAFQGDLTRVVTFMISHEGSDRVYSSVGIAEGHHQLTHHHGDVDKIEKVARINRLHVETFARLLKKLRSTAEEDGNLLDHSIMLYGSSLSDGNTHLHNNLPLIVAGGAFQGGRHVRYANETPMTNLLLTVLDRAGIATDRLGDSTGALTL